MLRSKLLLAAGLILALALALAVPLTAISASRIPVRIGGKNFTEQLLLTEITSRYLKAHGVPTIVKNGLGTTIMRQALETGQLDLVWDYTGTALIVYHHSGQHLTGRESFEEIRRLDRLKNLIWLEPSALNNTYAIAVPRATAARDQLRTLDDFAEIYRSAESSGENVRRLLGTDYEFPSRIDGLHGLENRYGFYVPKRQIKRMDSGLVYLALKNRQLYAGLTYASDGRISGFDLVLLEDNRGYFPAYLAAPVVRSQVLKDYPQLSSLMNRLAKKVDTATMREMNRKIDIDQLPVNIVAKQFLTKNGLLEKL